VATSSAAVVNHININSQHPISDTSMPSVATTKNVVQTKSSIKLNSTKSKVGSSNVLTSGLTLAQIKDGLSRAQKFYNSKGRLPNYVSYGTRKIPISQFQKILASKGLKIIIKSSTTKTQIHGYWINNGPSVLNKINIVNLKNSGITDIFVLTNKLDPKGTLQPFIDAFSGSGIKVHAWIVCFKNNGNWYDPGTNPTLVNNLDNNIISIAKNYNVDGIQLDYVRYPGTAYKHANATEIVTSFVQNIYNNIQKINNQKISGKHKILLSAALMPECDKNAYYYGQDYSKLAPYLNFLVPMIYKGNYNQNTAWIGTITHYIVQHAMGTPVVAGIQTYLSDAKPTPLPANGLINDIIVAIKNGSSGYVLFKYGLVDNTIQSFPN